MNRRFLLRLKQIAIMFVVTVLLLEIGLRIMGFKVHELPKYSLISQPEKHILPNPTMGVTLREGSYSITINEHLKYTATHLQNGQRTCGRSLLNNTLKRKKIAFYGCSFTYGMGVNDSEAYPFLLQQQFPTLHIENHAVPGYGQAQVILELVKNSSEGEKPDILILNYLSFHNERNSMNSAYQQKIRDGFALSKKIDVGIDRYTCYYPYGSIKNGSLQLGSISIQSINSTLPLIDYSAAVNAVQQLRDKKGVNPEQDEKITLAMINRIHELCKEQHIELVLTYMMNDETTQRLIAHCNTKSIPTIECVVDLSKKGYTNAPYDQHPSKIAHKIYAGKIAQFLVKLP